MINLLSSDIYKLYKRKSPYVFLIILLGLAILETGIIYLAIHFATETYDYDYTVSAQLPALVFSSLSNLFIAIFSALYISSEFSYGTMKNITSRGYSRMAVYLSKYICVVLFSFVLLVANVFFNIVTLGIFFGFGTFSSTMLQDILLLSSLSLLINCAVCAVYTFFSFLLANVGSALAINLVINTLMGMILSLIDFGLYIVKSEVSVSRYWINNLSGYLSVYSPADKDVRITLIAAPIYIVFFLFCGIVIFGKRDIKA